LPNPPLPTSGVKKPCPGPGPSGLSCALFGRKGISEVELLGIGFGERVGGRDVREADRENDEAGGSGKRCSDRG
jgi:hypothetical protein